MWAIIKKVLAQGIYYQSFIGDNNCLLLFLEE